MGSEGVLCDGEPTCMDKPCAFKPTNVAAVGVTLGELLELPCCIAAAAVNAASAACSTANPTPVISRRGCCATTRACGEAAAANRIVFLRSTSTEITFGNINKEA